jgi:hypothetical protein
MRLLFLISLLFVYTVVPAKTKIKADSANLDIAMKGLYTAMVKKDSVSMNKLIHKKVSYGHSNNWIQNKKEMVADLYSGTLSYSKIEQSDVRVQIVRGTAIVRSIMNVDAVMSGKALSFKLQVLQVWVWKNKEGWKIIGRQGVGVKE